MRPVCVNCNHEMRPILNDAVVVHFLNNEKSLGIDYVIYGDKYRCENCDVEIVIGFSEIILGYDLSDDHIDHILSHKYTEVIR